MIISLTVVAVYPFLAQGIRIKLRPFENLFQ